MELLTAWLQENLLMKKEMVTEAELLDAAVEHNHESSVGSREFTHWPNHRPDIDSYCLDHAILGCSQ